MRTCDAATAPNSGRDRGQGRRERDVDVTTGRGPRAQPAEAADSRASERYLSKAALARLWNVHPNTVQRLVAARQIRFIRVRGQLRFRPQDIDEFEARFGVAPMWGEDAA